jgi:hypothetical protein
MLVLALCVLIFVLFALMSAAKQSAFMARCQQVTGDIAGRLETIQAPDEPTNIEEAERAIAELSQVIAYARAAYAELGPGFDQHLQPAMAAEAHRGFRQGIADGEKAVASYRQGIAEMRLQN